MEKSRFGPALRGTCLHPLCKEERVCQSPATCEGVPVKVLPRAEGKIYTPVHIFDNSTIRPDTDEQPDAVESDSTPFDDDVVAPAGVMVLGGELIVEPFDEFDEFDDDGLDLIGDIIPESSES